MQDRFRRQKRVGILYLCYTGTTAKGLERSTCYMLADHWMEQHGIAQALFTPGEARTTLYTWIEQRWEEPAVRHLQKKLDRVQQIPN